VTGGTRVTIIGEAFQEPVQVLFDTAEARVLDVGYNQILVETPAARDTAPTGSGTVVGPVTVSVKNINSNQTSSLAAAFNYKAAMQITGVTVISNADGTARLTIDGIGFIAPLIAVVRTGQGDISLSQISVSGTRIVAIAPRVIPETCGTDLEGPVVVTNIVNGDQALGPIFGFPVLEPQIVSITPTIVTIGVNTSVAVRVLNPIPGVTRFIIGGKTLFPSGSVNNGDGSVTFTVPLPTNLDFPTEECGTDGERDAPLDVNVEYVASNDPSCNDQVVEALTVSSGDATCRTPPAPEADVTAPPQPGCLTINAPNNTTNTSGIITIANTGNAGLTVSAAAFPAVSFTVLPANATIPAGGSQNFTVTFIPAGGGDVLGNVAFTTNDADEATINVCVVGNVP
jgi:hypothetical protein